MVTAINNSGHTAGIYTDPAGNTHGYTDINGVFTTVDDHASTVFNQALGINNADTTVGYYAPTQAGTTNQMPIRNPIASLPTSITCCPRM